MKHAADTIKFFRAKEGLTQAQLAAAAGIDQGDVSDHEQGKRQPRASTLKKYAKVFRVSFWVLQSLAEKGIDERSLAAASVPITKGPAADRMQSVAGLDVAELRRRVHAIADLLDAFGLQRMEELGTVELRRLDHNRVPMGVTKVTLPEKR